MASYSELVGILKAVLRAVHARTMSANGTLFETAMRLLREADAGRNTPTPWTAFSEAEPMRRDPPTEAALARMMAETGRTREQVLETWFSAADDYTVHVNSRYQVLRRQIGEHAVHLSIKRIDQEPMRSWRDLQRIKNELVGSECEAVELYPAESRLVDSANQYHLFAYTDPALRMPFGFDDGRLVTDTIGGGEGQEPLA